MFDGRRRPDRSWLRPLEASVASLPAFEFIRPEIALAAPVGARVVAGCPFFKVDIQSEVNVSDRLKLLGCLVRAHTLI